MKTIKILFFTIIIALFGVTTAFAMDTDNMETKIIVIDIDQNSNLIPGFKYLVTDAEGKEYLLESVNEFTSEITLKEGKYTLKEVKTVDGFEKSKDVEIILPIGDDFKRTTELSIYPKHFHKSNTEIPANEPKTDGKNPEYDNNKGKSHEVGGPVDLGKRESTPDKIDSGKTDIKIEKATTNQKDTEKTTNNDINKINKESTSKSSKNKYTKTGSKKLEFFTFIQLILLGLIIKYFLVKKYEK